MKFVQMTDKEWETIEPFLPEESHRGRPRRDLRLIVDGIRYILITGVTWENMPKEFGSKSTAHRWFQRLVEEGSLKKIFDKLAGLANAQKKIKPENISVDSSSIPAKQGGDLIGRDGNKKITGTKIHAAVGTSGLPVEFILGPANVHDSKELIPILKKIFRNCNSDFVKKIRALFADKAYSDKKIREFLEDQGLLPCIPHKKNSKEKIPKEKEAGYSR